MIQGDTDKILEELLIHFNRRKNMEDLEKNPLPLLAYSLSKM
jgi:hypothetical protein